MSSTDPTHSTDHRPELVFALVDYAGTRLDDLLKALKHELKTFGYQTIDIRLSKLLEILPRWTDQAGTSEFDRITYYQDRGNAFRKLLENGDALARIGIAEIGKKRAEISGYPNTRRLVYVFVALLCTSLSSNRQMASLIYIIG